MKNHATTGTASVAGNPGVMHARGATHAIVATATSATREIVGINETRATANRNNVPSSIPLPRPFRRPRLLYPARFSPRRRPAFAAPWMK